MLADSCTQPRDLRSAIGRAIDDHMTEGLGERHEVPLRIDHDLLDKRGALLKQSAQQVRLARPAIALHEQAGGQQFLDVDLDFGPAGSGTDND